MSALADPGAGVASTLAAAFAERDRLTLDAWAEAHRTLGAGGAAASRRGRFSFALTPYLREVARRIDDPAVREIACKKSAQTGATELLISAALRSFARGELAFYVFPTERKGKKLVKERLVPAVHDCPPAAAALADVGRPMVADEVRGRAASLELAYTHSSDSLKSTPCGRIYGDEFDEFKPDAADRARSRTTTFPDAKLLWVSTPEHELGIVREYDQADVRNEYHVPCPHCGRFFELARFEYLRWDGGVRADPADAARSARVVPPCCATPIGQALRPWMVEHGLWLRVGRPPSTARPGDPEPRETIESDGTIARLRLEGAGHEPLSSLGSDLFRVFAGPHARAASARVDADAARAARERFGVRILPPDATGETPTGNRWAYRFNELLSGLSRRGWAGIAEEFVRHRGHPPRQWFAERLGRLPDSDRDTPEVAHVRRLCVGPADPLAGPTRGHLVRTLPPWCATLVAGVDVQAREVYVDVLGFGPRGVAPTLIDSVRVPTDPAAELRDVEPVLAALRYADDRGRSMAPATRIIDARYRTVEVLALVRRLNARLMRGGGVPAAVPVMGVDAAQTTRPTRWTQLDHAKDPTTGARMLLEHPVQVLLVHREAYREKLAARLRPPEADTPLAADAVLRGREPGPDAADPLRLPAADASWPEADEVLEHLTNERPVTKLVRHRPVVVWEPKSSHARHDHADAVRYAMAGADAFQVAHLTRDAANLPAPPDLPPPDNADRGAAAARGSQPAAAPADDLLARARAALGRDP